MHVHKHQLYLLEQHSEPLNRGQQLLRINTDYEIGPRLVMSVYLRNKFKCDVHKQKMLVSQLN